MLIVGSISTEKEVKEMQYILKVVVVTNRIKDIARGV